MPHKIIRQNRIIPHVKPKIYVQQKSAPKFRRSYHKSVIQTSYGKNNFIFKLFFKAINRKKTHTAQNQHRGMRKTSPKNFNSPISKSAKHKHDNSGFQFCKFFDKYHHTFRSQHFCIPKLLCLNKINIFRTRDIFYFVSFYITVNTNFKTKTYLPAKFAAFNKEKS